MVAVRSFIFNVVFYLNIALWCLVAVASFVLPGKATLRVAQTWARSSLWLTRVVGGIGVEWRGLEKIPGEACLIAVKHQSAWETFSLLVMFPSPTFVVKRELIAIPFFGWCMWKSGMIPIDRDAGRDALAGLVGRVREALGVDQEVTPYLRDSFEPILRGCQAQIDAEGAYLPDDTTLPSDQPVPAANDRC